MSESRSITAQASGHGGKLDRKWEQAITALLANATVGSAAKACGIGEATLKRWMQLPDFQTAYDSARQQVMTDAIHLLQKACTSAVGTLVSIMSDKGNPSSVRVTAATRVLELAFKGKELLELEERLNGLEAALDAQNAREANARNGDRYHA